MPDQTFSVTFTSSASSTPTIVYGINDYTCGDLMIEENFESTLTNASVTGFMVIVVSTGSTTPRKFGISYLMSWNITSLAVVSLSYSNVTRLPISNSPWLLDQAVGA